MKIGIDISQTVYGGGVSAYTENLVNALLQIDKTNEYRLFFSSLRKRKKSDRSEIKAFRIPPTGLDILWNRLHIWPIERFVGSVDVFHSSDWTQPPAQKARLVTTIHDLSFLRWPKSTHPKILAVQKRRLKWVKKEVDQIIVPSQATKKEVVALLQINPKKITVTGEGIPKDVEKFAGTNYSLEATKKKFNIQKRYIFAYGSRAPRKNIKRLIEAFRKIDREYQLVIVGDYRPQEKLAPGVILTGFLPRKEMLALFAGAHAFVYPSLYEGFGLPILESFALKVPVITSHTSSMAEVAGKAALLVDPKSTIAITEGIKKVLGNTLMRRQLIKRGQKRLKLFSWEKTARQTLAVYEKTT